MKTYDVIVRFHDGDSITLKNCKDFVVSKDLNCFYVYFSSGYHAFFNKDAVAFIGREFDIKQDKEA